MPARRLPRGMAAPMRGFWTAFRPRRTPSCGRPKFWRRSPATPPPAAHSPPIPPQAMSAAPWLRRVYGAPRPRPRQKAPHERRSSAMTANRKGILLMIAAVRHLCGAGRVFAASGGHLQHADGGDGALLVLCGLCHRAGAAPPRRHTRRDPLHPAARACAAVLAAGGRDLRDHLRLYPDRADRKPCGVCGLPAVDRGAVRPGAGRTAQLATLGGGRRWAGGGADHPATGVGRVHLARAVAADFGVRSLPPIRC